MRRPQPPASLPRAREGPAGTPVERDAEAPDGDATTSGLPLPRGPSSLHRTSRRDGRGGCSDSRARGLPLTYWTSLPGPSWPGAHDAGRSRSPLRGSSGFAPDSLVGLSASDPDVVLGAFDVPKIFDTGGMINHGATRSPATLDYAASQQGRTGCLSSTLRNTRH